MINSDKNFCGMMHTVKNGVVDMNASRSEKIKTVILIVLTVLLLPVLIVNLTLIVKGSLNSETPPDVFGIAPLAVTSGSMSGENEDSFDEGALIFVRLLDEEEIAALETGDIITFVSSDVYVTHRIIAVNRDAGGNVISFVTQGDANNTTDGAIPIENVIGQCVGHVAGLGGFAIFMQTPAGILVIVGVPVLLFIAYDVLRIYLHNRRVREEEGREMREKDEEIERLRAQLGARSAEENRDNAEDPSSRS